MAKDLKASSQVNEESGGSFEEGWEEGGGGLEEVGRGFEEGGGGWNEERGRLEEKGRRGEEGGCLPNSFGISLLNFLKIEDQG